MDKILQQYNDSVADVAKLKKKAKSICEDQKAKEKKPTYEKGEDGWIKVNRDRKDTKSVIKKKKDKVKLINFYAFELKEEKLKKHKELLEKFEQDKKRIMEMRAKRKFKV